MESESFDLGDVPTSAVSFVETEHGRLRRKQRGIDKKDLQAAKKYGTKRNGSKTKTGDPATVYTFNDIVYVTNTRTGEEITAYALPVELESVSITKKIQDEHNDALERIRSNEDSWVSNSVIVVDTSGSMRSSDVWGSKTRLGAVWIAIALDFIAQRLEAGTACPMDVVSIVCTQGNGTMVLVHEQPCSWVLYNEILLYSMVVKPRGHGPYFPSLQTAESLLTRNSNASCALTLLFLSDGRPSDPYMPGGSVSHAALNVMLSDRVGKLAKRFGRQLTFAGIGIGDSGDDFSVLRDMVDAAKDYGAIGFFQLPSLTSSGIGDTFTSVATSLTTTQMEMKDPRTLKQRKVRNVLRESRKKAAQRIKFVSSDEFDIYSSDQVERAVYSERVDNKGQIEGKERRATFEVAPLQSPNAQAVAISKEAFGEGAERLAYRFFELAGDRRTIIGRPLVAKESRLIFEEDFDNEGARKSFAHSFCKTQQLARRLAVEFNDKLDSIPRLSGTTPRVTFLDCSIYQLDDSAGLGKLSVLVEERLDESKWKKWNANNGYIEGMDSVPKFTQEILRRQMTKLDAIEERSDDDDDEEERSEDDDEEIDAIKFTPSDVAQAFSHFSYWATGRKRLVCDLQGVYDDSARMLKFSDPSIHYHDHLRAHRRFVHGCTDGGHRGMAKFFNTHRCSGLCKLVTRGFVEASRKRKSECSTLHTENKKRYGSTH
jgi:Mg-chelatase subunit ChlD